MNFKVSQIKKNIFLIFFYLAFSNTTWADSSFRVEGWISDIPSDFQLELSSLNSNVNIINEVSVQCYKVLADGTLEPKTVISSSEEIEAIKNTCSQNRIKLFALVHNEFNDVLVRKIINNNDLMTSHIQALLSMVKAGGFDGVDIDYESLDLDDRDPFTKFIQQLSDVFHQNNKQVAVCVYSKTEEPGRSHGAQAQDWGALGQTADIVEVMAFCYHYTTGKPGPIAPLPWFKQILYFALKQIPPQKIRMALPTYGVDWVGSSGTEMSAQGAVKLAGIEDAKIQWSTNSNSPHFDYTRMDQLHKVWYEDARCVPEKIKAAMNAKVGGVCIWRLGAEPEGFWKSLTDSISSKQ